MYSKLFTFATLAAAVLAVSADTNKCNVGEVQCCNSVQAAHSGAVQGIAQKNSLVAAALALAPVTIPVGLECSPLSAIGIAGNSWSVPFLCCFSMSCWRSHSSAQPVCCDNNNFSKFLLVFLVFPFVSVLTWVFLIRRCCCHWLHSRQRQPLDTPCLAYISPTYLRIYRRLIHGSLFWLFRVFLSILRWTIFDVACIWIYCSEDACAGFFRWFSILDSMSLIIGNGSAKHLKCCPILTSIRESDETVQGYVRGGARWDDFFGGPLG